MSADKDLGDAAAPHDVELIEEVRPTAKESACDPPLSREECEAMLRSLLDAHRQLAELRQVVDVIRLQLARLSRGT